MSIIIEALGNIFFINDMYGVYISITIALTLDLELLEYLEKYFIKLFSFLSSTTSIILPKIVNTFNEECGKEKSQAHNKIVNDVFEEEKNI